MREVTTAIKEFDKPTEPVWDSKIVNVFQLPDRNWDGLIDDYNSSNKRKFQFTGVQCKAIIEYVKQGIPPQHIFETMGISNARYANLVNKAAELDEQLEIFAIKEQLTDEEQERFQEIMRNPFRVLISDIARASGVSKLADWELFNLKAAQQPDLLMAKMRARYKEFFAEKDAGTGNVQVQINLGGDFVSKM